MDNYELAYKAALKRHERKMEKIITFIIPAYNMEKFLACCLDSFLCPEIMNQIEVITVNDGSTDQTGEIADQYARDYPDTFRVIHKSNGGHGSAINAGSREAKGQYFKVVDSDDWVVTENLPQFIRVLSKSNADVVLTAFDMIDMKTGRRVRRQINTKGEVGRFTMEEVVRNPSYFEPCAVFHGITYCTRFYQEQGYTLAEHVFYEDQEYSTLPFCNAETIEVYPICIYQYRIGNDSQSISFSNQAKRIGHLETIIWRMSRIYYQENVDTEASKEYLRYKLRSIVLIYYATALVYENDKKRGRELAGRMYQKLTKHLPDISNGTDKQYRMYYLMNKLQVRPERYQQLVQSKLYFQLKQGMRMIGHIALKNNK